MVLLVYARREGDAVWQSGCGGVPLPPVDVDGDLGDGPVRADSHGCIFADSSASSAVPGAARGATGAGAGPPCGVGSPGSARRKIARKTSEVEVLRSGGRGDNVLGAWGSGAGADAGTPK